jgi:sugar phosphate isomerase/epimerase
MRSAITISLVGQAKGGPFVFWDDLAAGCEKAAALGFDAVEIFAPAASAIDRKALHRLLLQHRLKVAAVGSGAGWVIHKWHLCHADSRIRQQAREFIAQMIDLGGEFGAPAIIGSMQGRFEGTVSRAQAVTWLREALDHLSELAAQHQQQLLFEPLNRYETNLFNGLADTVTFLQTVKANNVKILADLFHMNIEEVSICEALRAAGKFIGHIHFADSNRLAIGLGHTEMGPVIKALQEIGYAGYLSAEVLPLPDSETAAQQSVTAFRQLTAC